MEHPEVKAIAEMHNEIREHLTKEILLWAWRLGVDTHGLSIFEIATCVLARVGEKPPEDCDGR